MKKGIRWGGIFVVIYILALLIQLPAKFSYEKIVPAVGIVPNPNLTVQSISGTLWRGEVADLQYRQQPLGLLKWNLNLLPLLIGELSSSWSVEHAAGLLQGDVSVDGEIITLNELQGKLHPSMLLPLFPFTPFTVDGMLTIDMKKLQLTGNRPSLLLGKVEWQQAQVTMTEPLDLGNVDLIFDTNQENGEITGQVTNLEGALEISSKIIIQADGSYQIETSLKPRNSRDQQLTNMLSILGKPDRSGVIRFSQNGKI
ncbi:MAG: type II secretion system protein N [Gammaproteobacteria bacterium]|nr:type II secretion system protein N [Gammaproteobacteria bacterium]